MSLAVRAAQTLTGASFADTETVVIGGKTYTFKGTLSNTDGFVQVGASDTESLANLKAAINLEAGAGTKYAAATTEHPSVKAVSSNATTLVIKAKVPGTIGNSIATTETCGSASWGSTVMAGGSGDASADIRTILSECQLSAAASQRLVDLVDADADE